MLWALHLQLPVRGGEELCLEWKVGQQMASAFSEFLSLLFIYLFINLLCV